MAKAKGLAVLEMGLGAAGLAAGLGGALAGHAFIQEYLYFFAWHPFIALLDGWLMWRTGENWLWTRPRQLAKLCGWSVTVWLIFEVINLRLGNWGYVGIAPERWIRWPGYALAFATVLPGVLLTAQVLQVQGWWQGRSGRPLNLGAWPAPSLLLGATLLMLPLLAPNYAFPCVWLAFIFLLDPINALWGGHSLISAWLAGQRQEHYCLMAAGLLCGLWWEAWNALSTAKWIYTLPALNFGKIFEMPFLGYLGFMPFALECAVMYNFFKALEAQVFTSPARRRAALLVTLALWLAAFAAMDAWTVRSFSDQ